MAIFPFVSGKRSDGGAAGGGSGLRLGRGEGGGGGVGAEDDGALGFLKWDHDPAQPDHVSEPRVPRWAAVMIKLSA